jgi:beta-glucanase (GH16 family)
VALAALSAGCGQGRPSAKVVSSSGSSEVTDPPGGGNVADAGAAGAVFFDDFAATTLSPAWVAMDRHGDYQNDVNSELQCYLPGNVTLSGGNLLITSKVQTQMCGDATHPTTSWNYTSGMVQWSTFSFTYGTLEFRAKIAGGTGTWPALWLLGAKCQISNVTTADNVGTCDWPNVGSDEIDVTEILYSNPSFVNEQIHSGSNNSGCTAATTDVSKNWHVYRLVWTAASLVWMIDGVQTCKITSAIPSTPMFLIINTALGNAAGAVSNSTLPQTMSVDYVRVTQP